MKKDDVLSLVMDELLPQHDTEHRKLKRIDLWLRNKPEMPRLPRKATREHKALQEMAKDPYLALVVTTIVQTLDAERIYSSNLDKDALAEAWLPWQRNGMEARQVPLYRDAYGLGLSYTRVLPGDLGAVITARSPLNTYAVYQDPANDEFPMYVLEVDGEEGARRRSFSLWDEEAQHMLSFEDGKIAYLEPREHTVGVSPFIRYAPYLDLLGRAPGGIEPLLPVAAKINKTSYDRLLAQHFNSWRVRTATNLDESVSGEEAQQRKMKLAQDDILTGGEGVQFGTLPETNLEHFIKAKEDDVEELAATSQTPITAFAKLINVSADGLVEARASLNAKRDEHKKAFGLSHVQTLRLAAHVEGRSEHAEDFTMRIGWADTDARTMNQAVDALGKAAQMLDVPAELLWDLIPGIDFTTAESWRKYADENPTAQDRLAEAYTRQIG